jgi:hypothetical protein
MSLISTALIYSLGGAIWYTGALLAVDKYAQLLIGHLAAVCLDAGLSLAYRHAMPDQNKGHWP